MNIHYPTDNFYYLRVTERLDLLSEVHKKRQSTLHLIW